MPIASFKLHEEKYLTKLNGEIDKSTFIFGNFSTSISVIHRNSKQKSGHRRRSG